MSLLAHVLGGCATPPELAILVRRPVALQVSSLTCKAVAVECRGEVLLYLPTHPARSSLLPRMISFGAGMTENRRLAA